ncbi:T-complex protein 1 subunit theta-like, partial [Ctenocephalides felis]
MALHVPKAPGVHQMLRGGARVYSGMEEAVLRNINACKEFSHSLRTAFGPNGMAKIIVNYLNNQFVTSDAATIVRELEIQHPAIKVLADAAFVQQDEMGDAVNYVIILAGALLEYAEEPLSMGVTPAEIADGYELALAFAENHLTKMVAYDFTDICSLESVKKILNSVIQSRQFGLEDVLTPLVAQGCVAVRSATDDFSTGRLRVCKILGGGLHASTVVRGMVLKRIVSGVVRDATDAGVAVYDCPVDYSRTETKGTVLFHTAAELRNYSHDEDRILEEQIRALAEAGVKVVVCSGKVGDMALHFLNKHHLMVVRLISKFDLLRVSEAVGARVLCNLKPPLKEELGHSDEVIASEIGDNCVIIFRRNRQINRVDEGKGDSIVGCPLATVLLRGATDAAMDNAERAMQSALAVYNAALRDGRFVAGAGATEIELRKELLSHANTLPGMEQYAIRQFAKALEIIPRCIAENTGANATESLDSVIDAHNWGHMYAGMDIETQ